MRSQGGRRFWWNRRRVGLVLAAALALLLVLVYTLLRPWPLERSPATLQHRLDAAVIDLADYAERIEASLRIQFLEAALRGGRRSTELQVDYLLLEEQLEPIIARMPPEEGSALGAELSGLLPDLSRDRSAAARRLVEMQELLLPTVGLERQGDNQ